MGPQQPCTTVCDIAKKMIQTMLDVHLLALVDKTFVTKKDILEHSRLLTTDESKKRKIENEKIRKEKEEAASEILDICEASMDSFTSDRYANVQWVKEQFNFELSMLDALYDLALFYYQCGLYSLSADTLNKFLYLSTDADQCLSARWGKLSAEILSSHWQNALSDFNNLRQEIESRTFPSNYHLLQHRKNLLLWSLFIFFNTNELDMMIDLFLQPSYFNTIQTSFPEMLKYLTAVVIIQRHYSHDLLKTLNLNVQQGAIIDFYQSLFSFPCAKKLSLAVAEISKDAFMKGHADIFSKQAKALLLESLSKLHVSLKLSVLLKQLGLTNAQDITALLPNVTIDSKKDSLIFSKSSTSCLTEKINQVELKVKALITTLEQGQEEN